MVGDMWEVFSNNPLGRLSMRKYLRFASALLMACFLYIFLTTPTALAADAQWNGNAITYNGHDYENPRTASDSDGLNLPTGTIYYVYLPPVTGPESLNTKAYVIYFTTGVDPPTATSVKHAVYDFDGTKYSNQSNVKTITLAAAPEATPTTPTTSEGTTSCAIERIGWIVCPVTDFLAWGMDTLYSALISFLKVEPLQNGNNSLYRAWEVMRNLSNVAFVIAFMLVIYSQLVGGGLSNYSLKKMVPRLIIAAILVNVSYWICAVAVDISNILGSSVQDLFMSMRSQIVGTETNDNFGWGEISGYVLSGGAIGTVGILVATGGSIASGIFLLLGALVTVMFAAFVAVIVLAARQALIIILIIVAPLAFVAYLLPNTEKWFEKWRQVFMTMLLLFPIFSVIFGGSQLAGAAIIQNASTLNVLILGMAVQIAPLVITPLLIKFSGGLIGKIAGMANNTSKGAVDGVKNWTKGNAELHKNRALGTPTRKRNVFRRSAQSMNRGRMYREGMTKKYQDDAENLFSGSAKGERLHEAKHWTEQDKQRVEKTLERDLNQKIRSNSGLLERDMNVRVTVEEAAASSARLDAVQQELKAGNWSAFGYGPQGKSITDLVNRNEEATRDIAVTAMRKQSAEVEQKSQLTQALLTNTQQIDGKVLRDYAGGIRGIAGAESVLASAVAASREEYGKQVSEKTQLIKHFNLSSTERQNLAMGSDVPSTKNGVDYIFKSTDEYAREAAIEDQLKTGSFYDIMNIVNASGAQAVHPTTGQAINPGATFDYRTTISAAIASNGLDNKALFWGAKTINDVAQGTYLNTPGNTEAQAAAIVYNVINGKVKAEKLAVQDATALRAFFEVQSDPAFATVLAGYSPAEAASFNGKFENIRHAARDVVEKTELRKLASDSALTELDRFKL